MNQSETETVVLNVLGTVLKCEVGPDSSRQNMPQWDSLKHIEVIFTVEDELGLRFSEAELARLDSVARIVEAALSQHAA